MKIRPLLSGSEIGRIAVRSALLVCTLVGIASLGIGCLMPGQLYVVAPEVLGEIRGESLPESAPTLRLSVRSREVPTLFDAKTIALSEDRRFQFDEAKIAVAGREFSKVYRVFLHYRVGEEDRVIWRGEFSRRALSGPIKLDCDLDRPGRLGQPCRVRDPLEQQWLVDNGERVFERLCVECHGAGGRGLDASEPGSEHRAPRLDRIAARRASSFSHDDVAEWIEGSLIPRKHGSREMPIWGERLSEEYWRYSNADELVGATLDPVLVFLMSIQSE